MLKINDNIQLLMKLATIRSHNKVQFYKKLIMIKQ